MTLALSTLVLVALAAAALVVIGRSKGGLPVVNGDEEVRRVEAAIGLDRQRATALVTAHYEFLDSMTGSTLDPDAEATHVARAVGVDAATARRGLDAMFDYLVELGIARDASS